MLNINFKLYDNLENALNDINPWLYCNFNDEGVAFPRDCGPTEQESKPYQWQTSLPLEDDKTTNNTKGYLGNYNKLYNKGKSNKTTSIKWHYYNPACITGPASKMWDHLDTLNDDDSKKCLTKDEKELLEQIKNQRKNLKKLKKRNKAYMKQLVHTRREFGIN